MSYLNRKHNASNPYQGEFKKVLCVCSAGLLRSPTAALVLSGEPFSFNTRAAGLEEDYALIPVDGVLLSWADEVVCMTEPQAEDLRDRLTKLGEETKVINLGIEDTYMYRDQELADLVRTRYITRTEGLENE